MMSKLFQRRPQDRIVELQVVRERGVVRLHERLHGAGAESDPRVIFPTR